MFSNMLSYAEGRNGVPVCCVWSGRTCLQTWLRRERDISCSTLWIRTKWKQLNILQVFRVFVGKLSWKPHPLQNVIAIQRLISISSQPWFCFGDGILLHSCPATLTNTVLLLKVKPVALIRRFASRYYTETSANFVKEFYKKWKFFQILHFFLLMKSVRTKYIWIGMQ
jgi:hypothetical protein